MPTSRQKIKLNIHLNISACLLSPNLHQTFICFFSTSFAKRTRHSCNAAITSVNVMQSERSHLRTHDLSIMTTHFTRCYHSLFFSSSAKVVKSIRMLKSGFSLGFFKELSAKYKNVKIMNFVLVVPLEMNWTNEICDLEI